MDDKTVFVKDFSMLSLKIFIVGYPEQGESVLCLLMEEQRVIFSFVVDSFSLNNGATHIVCDLLAEFKAQKINKFIWTHPDFDHSIGIEQLLDLYDINREADIYISEGVINSLDILKSHACEVYNYLNKYYNTCTKYNLNKVSIFKGENRSLQVVEILEMSSGRVITCNLQFIAPLSSKVIRQEFNKTKDYNAMSIMFILSLNKINYLFCGDIEDSTLVHINKSFFKNTKFVKIPHHGSNTSLKLVEYLRINTIKDAVAVSTVFKAKNLPMESVIDCYKPICQCLYCTSSGDKNFGYVQLDYDILKGDFVPKLVGNAIKVF